MSFLDSGDKAQSEYNRRAIDDRCEKEYCSVCW
jgi:hypothetical protein